MAEIKFEIVKALGVLATSEKGWTKELNLVSWNDRPARFDLREWNPDHTLMSKGVTLNDAEMKALKELLGSLEL